MRPFLVFLSVLSLCLGVAACGKRPDVLATPTDQPPIANGYPAVEPIPDQPKPSNVLH